MTIERFVVRHLSLIVANGRAKKRNGVRVDAVSQIIAESRLIGHATSATEPLLKRWR